MSNQSLDADLSEIVYENDEFEIRLDNNYRHLEISVAVILLVYLFLGLSGNLLTIVALLRCQRVRNVTAAFIISLCVADCMFCVLVLPWEVSRFFAGKWAWGEGLICTVLPLIRYWNVAVSLLSIAMITINRYIMIAHFGVYKNVYKKGWIALMILFCWVFPLAILMPTLLGKWGRFGKIEALQTCSIIDENGQSPKKVLFALGFCVPAAIIIICYSLIFKVIQKSEMRLQKHTTTQKKPSITNSRSDLNLQTKISKKIAKENSRKRNEWRITKMVLIIFITFLVAYLPITLVKFFDPMGKYTILQMLGYILIYVSCCINPVIYVIMNRQYRQAYRTVLFCNKTRIISMSSQIGLGRQRNKSTEASSNSKKRLSLPVKLIHSTQSKSPEIISNRMTLHENQVFCTDFSTDTTVSKIDKSSNTELHCQTSEQNDEECENVYRNENEVDLSTKFYVNEESKIKREGIYFDLDSRKD